MMHALKQSPESKELIELAMRYLRGVKGKLVQQKKREREKANALAAGSVVPTTIGPDAAIPRPLPGAHPENYPAAYPVPTRPAPTQPTAIYPGLTSIGGSMSGIASGSNGTNAPVQHQQRFNELEAEIALNDFLGRFGGAF
jgi:hypothetical protein